jgi:hypothetical protein
MSSNAVVSWLNIQSSTCRFPAEYSVICICILGHSICKMTVLPSSSAPQLYSNTPSDFDFKLERWVYLFSLLLLVVHFGIFSFGFHFYSLAQEFRSLTEFAEHLSANVDIVFPVIHGKFGEDGGIQVSSCQ